jgi:hypothetical protein
VYWDIVSENEKASLGMDVNYDLFRSLAIVTGAFILITFMADLYYSAAAPEVDIPRVMTIVFGASLLIVFIADHVSKSITASAVKSKAFILAIVIVVSLLTVFIADYMSGVLSASADEVKAFIAVLVAYILLYVGIKGLVWG